MKVHDCFGFVVIICIFLNPSLLAAKQIQWDLTDIYKNKKAWSKELKSVEKSLVDTGQCEGQLGQSSKKLHHCLQTFFSTRKQLSKVSTWTSLRKSTDLKNREFNEDASLQRNLSAKFYEAWSFLEPELILLGEEKIKKLSSDEEKFADYDQYLNNVIRQAKHTLSPKEEALISSLWPVINGQSESRNLLYTTDIQWRTVKLSNGKEIVANPTNYKKLRESENRKDRKIVFDAFYSVLKQYERTFGVLLEQATRSHTIMAKKREYSSALAAALSNNNVPEEVYFQLVKQVNAGLPTLHRYLKLRAKMLKIDDPGYHDLYPSLVESSKKYTITDSRKILLSGVLPLGKEYLEKTKSATSQKWMHVYPAEGKRSGAYMNGSAYDVHPYVFLNHQDSFDSMSTYVHEWGHALHSLLSNQSQPYPKARYPIFTAEVASTTSEALVMKDLLAKTKDPQERLFILGQELEQIRGTFFRQTQLGEFELAIHKEVESGKPLSGSRLSEIYLELVRRYYGHDKDIIKVDEQIALEWAYIPHFYYNFYVYQYATSISAGYFFADKILNGDESAREAARKKYIGLLKAGGSKYAYELLKEAGLDMKKPDAYRAIIHRMDEIIDEMEKILSQN